MNKLYAFLIVFLALSTLLTISVHPVKASGDLWIERAPLPNAEYRFGTISVNGEIYAIGHNFTYAFNPSTDTWVSKPPVPSHRQGFAIAAYQNKIYVIGGWNSTNPNTGISITLGTNEMYDPTTDTWTTKAPLPTATMNLQANVVNGKIYVISGMTNAETPSLSNATWVYDPINNSWSTAADIPNPVFAYASAVVGSKIYVEGGEFKGPPYYSNLNQIYDIETNTWSLGNPLPIHINRAAAGATAGTLAPARLYVVGGTNDGYHGVNTIQIYDPQTDIWTLGSFNADTALRLGSCSFK